MGAITSRGYPHTMAKKNKAKARPSSPDSPDISDTFALHFQASRRRDEILEEAKALQATGKVRDARKLLRQAHEMQKHLKALEENRNR
jgi:hypothetical protein